MDLTLEDELNEVCHLIDSGNNNQDDENSCPPKDNGENIVRNEEQCERHEKENDKDPKVTEGMPLLASKNIQTEQDDLMDICSDVIEDDKINESSEIDQPKSDKNIVLDVPKENKSEDKEIIDLTNEQNKDKQTNVSSKLSIENKHKKQKHESKMLIAEIRKQKLIKLQIKRKIAKTKVAFMKRIVGCVNMSNLEKYRAMKKLMAHWVLGTSDGDTRFEIRTKYFGNHRTIPQIDEEDSRDTSEERDVTLIEKMNAISNKNPGETDNSKKEDSANNRKSFTKNSTNGPNTKTPKLEKVDKKVQPSIRRPDSSSKSATSPKIQSGKPTTVKKVQPTHNKKTVVKNYKDKNEQSYSQHTQNRSKHNTPIGREKRRFDSYQAKQRPQPFKKQRNNTPWLNKNTNTPLNLSPETPLTSLFNNAQQIMALPAIQQQLSQALVNNMLQNIVPKIQMFNQPAVQQPILPQQPAPLLQQQIEPSTIPPAGNISYKPKRSKNKKNSDLPRINPWQEDSPVQYKPNRGNQNESCSRESSKFPRENPPRTLNYRDNSYGSGEKDYHYNKQKSTEVNVTQNKQMNNDYGRTPSYVTGVDTLRSSGLNYKAPVQYSSNPTPSYSNTFQSSSYINEPSYDINAISYSTTPLNFPHSLSNYNSSNKQEAAYNQTSADRTSKRKRKGKFSGTDNFEDAFVQERRRRMEQEYDSRNYTNNSMSQYI